MTNNQCKIKITQPKPRRLNSVPDEEFLIEKGAWPSFYETGDYTMVDENGGIDNVTGYTVSNWPS